MGNSSEFIKLKTLYFEEGYDVESVNIEISPREDTEWAEVTFDTGDGEKMIEGDSHDFVMQAFSLKSTQRGGEKQIIDISDTEAGNPEGYYELMEYFIDPPNEELREEAFERVESGDAEIPESVNIDEALVASINGAFSNKSLKWVVENYHEAVATRILQSRHLDHSNKQYQAKNANNDSRFTNYLNQAGEVLKERFLTESPKEDYQNFREDCIADLRFHISKLREINELHQEDIREITQRNPESLETKSACSTLLEHYARYYELVKVPYRDLYTSLQGLPDDNPSITTITEELESSDFEILSEALKPELRNAAFHLSYSIDEPKGSVEVFSGKDEERYSQGEFTLRELQSEVLKIQDLAPAVLFSFVTTQEILSIRYIESLDFIYQIIEGADPSYYE